MTSATIILDKRGRIAVQIEGNRVFDRQGRVIGWIASDDVYDRNGRHVGWFIGGLLRDAYGKVLGFSPTIDRSQPHPAIPGQTESAPTLSRQGPAQGQPGFLSRPGRPPMGGKPPMGASWSEFDVVDYFESR